MILGHLWRSCLLSYKIAKRKVLLRLGMLSFSLLFWYTYFAFSVSIVLFVNAKSLENANMRIFVKFVDFVCILLS